MARNAVQFQRGLSEAKFERLYGTEERCPAVVIAARWPDGFSCPVEIDDAYPGGERAGGKRGRGAPGKTPFLAAVETTPEGKPVRLKLRRGAGFTGQAISRFALRSLAPSCSVLSDDLACFGQVSDVGCAHEVIRTGSGKAAARSPAFTLRRRWLPSAKRWMTLCRKAGRVIARKACAAMWGMRAASTGDAWRPTPF